MEAAIIKRIVSQSAICDTVPTVCVFVKPVRIATCCPTMGILNEHMRSFLLVEDLCTTQDRQ